MKRMILVFFAILFVMSCGKGKIPEAVKLPDKNLEVKNGKVYYKGELFTGAVNAVDKYSDPEFPGKFRADIKEGEIEGKVELLASDIDYIYNISGGKLNGNVMILDVNIAFKNDVIQKCSSANNYLTKEMAEKFCETIKAHPDGESFPTTGKELQKRTLEIIERFNEE